MKNGSSNSRTTVGRYLVKRLEQAGLGHVFGIPGDYVLGFYDLLVDSKMQVVGTCTEAGAAFAADAYARLRGLGCVCITYCVGGLNTLNAVAGAYAEKAPIIFISGAPGLGERARSPLLHHKVRDFNTQRQIFEKVTVAAVSLEDPATAPRQIDETIAECIRHKRPVFIEIPRDVVDMPCPEPAKMEFESDQSDPAVLNEAIEETLEMLGAAKRPVILAGVEIHRFALQDTLLKLAEKSGYPIATTLLGKSVISERHPQYIGVYEGAMGREEVRQAVEKADCVLILGAFMTDINLGVYTAKLDIAKSINATSENIQISHHRFDDIVLKDFIEGLTRKIGAVTKKLPAVKKRELEKYEPNPRKLMTIRRFFARMEHFLEDDTLVIADIGDSLFGASDLHMHKRTDFISPAYYTSMGYAVPATIGAGFAKPTLRPIVFVGDGAFQMTGQELSVIARNGLNPIVFVLNNKGYTTERFIHEGPYNDIHDWSYHLFPLLLNKGTGWEVHTEGDLETVLEAAKANIDSFSIINVHLDPYDRSIALERLGKRLAKQGGMKAEERRTVKF